MTPGEGALIEPLAVATYACKRAGIVLGGSQKVLVTGAGPVGLLSCLAAKALGAEKVCITDIKPERLDFARSLGIESTIDIDPGREPEKYVEKVVEVQGGAPNVSIECSGAEGSVTLAIVASRDGATVVLVGNNSHKVNVPIGSAALREVNLLGVKRYRNVFPLAIHLVSSRAVDVKPLITHRFPVEKALEAFEVARTGRDNAVKVQIEF